VLFLVPPCRFFSDTPFENLTSLRVFPTFLVDFLFRIGPPFALYLELGLQGQKEVTAETTGDPLTQGTPVDDLRREEGAVVRRQNFLCSPLSNPKSPPGQSSYAFSRARPGGIGLPLPKPLSRRVYRLAHTPVPRSLTPTPRTGVLATRPHGRLSWFVFFVWVLSPAPSCSIYAPRPRTSSRFFSFSPAARPPF